MNADMGELPPPATAEFAIRFADGSMDDAYDEYVGPHTAVYADREAADYRCEQIISAGCRFADTNLIGAKVVSRLVTEWSS